MKKLKRHVNELLKSRLANSGRVAGAGISYDRYDEESGPELRDKWASGSAKVVMPGRSEEERAALDGPVISKRIEDVQRESEV